MDRAAAGAIADGVTAPQFRERHETLVAAAPAAVGAAVRRLDLSRSRSVRLLFLLRGLPRQSLALPGLLRLGFVVLEDGPNALRLGLIGRFWSLGDVPRRVEPAAFASFDEPGYASAVWSFEWRAEAGGTRLVTETTVRCTDEASRRRFGRYWRIVQPFSGWIRRRALAAIRSDAETAARESGSG